MKFKKNRIIVIFISLSLLFILPIIFKNIKLTYAGQSITNGNSIYVATYGDDLTNDGTLNAPFQTLEKALLVAPSNTTIYVKEGKYIFYEYILINQKKNITIRPFEDDEVVFTTSHEIKISDYMCNNDSNRVSSELRGNIACIDINKYLNDSNNHDFVMQKYLSNPSKRVELLNKFSDINQITIYSNDYELNVARYPNNDKYLLIDSVDSNNRNTTFYLENLVNRNWDLTSDNIYALGFWTYDWKARYSKVSATIDEANNHLLKFNVPDAFQEGEIHAGQRVAFYNIFEELDSPLEYYFDKKTNQLYVYMNDSIKNNDIIEYSFNYNDSVGDNEKSLFYICGSENIVIKDIIFKNIYTSAISADTAYIKNSEGIYERGAEVKNNILENNTFFNINNVAVYFRSGQGNIIRNNYFSKLGKGAIIINEYNRFRYNLTPQNNLVTNNKVEDFDKNTEQYVGIEIWGVGNTVSNNEINNSGSRAINFYGNNQIIEYNEIYDVCTKLSDGAAIYSGGNLTSSGNVVQYNYIHDVKLQIPNGVLNEEKKDLDYHAGIYGVYTDDLQGYVEVKNNIFSNLDGAYLINGGSFNKFTNNILINVKKGVQHYRPSIGDMESIMKNIKIITNSDKYDEDVWQEHNATLKENILDNSNNSKYIEDYISSTKGMVIDNNLAFGSGENDTVTSCEQLLEMIKSGDAAKNIFYLSSGENSFDDSNIVQMYENACKLYVKTSWYSSTSDIHYGDQTAYTNNKLIFKNYDERNFSVNLELLETLIPSFKQVYFSRMGKDKVIGMKVNIDNMKKEYIQNSEQLDLTNGWLELYYSNGGVKTINLSESEIEGFDNTTPGEIELVAKYNDERINFKVEIISKKVTNIEIIKLPLKLNYLQNKEELDLNGGILEVTYDTLEKAQFDLTDIKVNINGFNNNTAGKKNIIIEYQGLTTSFDVNIVTRQLKNIEIVSLPNKLNYINDKENLDLTGGILELIYDDGTKEQISFEDKRITISGVFSGTLGEKEITIECESLKVTYKINVISRKN